MTDHNEFQDAFSEQGFWTKLKHFARSAGREVVEKALLGRTLKLYIVGVKGKKSDTVYQNIKAVE